MSNRKYRKTIPLKQCIPNDGLQPTIVDRKGLLGGEF